METQQDLMARIQVAAEVIRDKPEMFPRVLHGIIRRYTTFIEVGGGHVEHLLEVNKMVLLTVYQLSPLLLS